MESMASSEPAVSNGTLPVTFASATPGEISATCSRLDLVRADEGRLYKHGQIIEPISHALASRTYFVTYMLLRAYLSPFQLEPPQDSFATIIFLKLALARSADSKGRARQVPVAGAS
jgi:hypothetical protein